MNTKRFVVTAFLLFCCIGSEAATDPLIPPVVRWGATVAALENALAGSCTKINTRRIDPPFLDGVKDVQMQIDCDGFPYLGKPRWAEFVIRDNSLEMVWIMTTKEEEPAILRRMIAAWGKPTHRNDTYAAFAGSRIAVRFKPAEVLLYSPSLEKEALSWFK